MARSNKHALVFGGTGLIGWRVVNELLSGYPEHGLFDRVTAVTNRSLTLEDAHWLDVSSDAPELQICSGVDLLNGTGDRLAATLETAVRGIQGVTHVFYFVFSPFSDDFQQECVMNCDIMRRVTTTVNTLCPCLESFVYSGGTRGYGIYDPSVTFKAPLVENMTNQLPEDYAKTVAYPWFREILTEAANGRGWTWTEVCPDVVVGFSPIGSGYSIALHWAQYLSLYAFNHGIHDSNAEKRAEIHFPGTEAGYDAHFTPVSTRILGRICVFASLNPDKLGGQVVNALDNSAPTTFRELWPEIAGWFGLIGVGPSNNGSSLAPSEYISKHRHLFEECGFPKGVTAGVGVGSKQLDAVGYWLSFDRLSSEKLRSIGFAEQQSPAGSWMEAFGKFKLAGIIF